MNIKLYKQITLQTYAHLYNYYSFWYWYSARCLYSNIGSCIDLTEGKIPSTVSG